MKKSKSRLTPKKAYKIVKDLANKAGVSINRYCEDRGVKSSTVSRWKTKDDSCTVMMSTYELLTR